MIYKVLPNPDEEYSTGGKKRTMLTIVDMQTRDRVRREKGNCNPPLSHLFSDDSENCVVCGIRKE